MPITVKYSPSARAIGDVAYQAGRGMAMRETAATEAKMAFQQEQAALSREHQLRVMQENADIQRRAAEEAQIRKLETGREIYRQKDQFQKDQIQQQRSRYVSSREKIEEARNTNQINDGQYDYAMRELQKRYAGQDIDVTDPYFADITKEDAPMWKAPDGTDMPMPMDSNGNPEPFKAQQEWNKTQNEKRRLDIQEENDRRKAEVEARKLEAEKKKVIYDDASDQAKDEAKDREAKIKEGGGRWSAVEKTEWIKRRTRDIVREQAFNEGEEVDSGAREVSAEEAYASWVDRYPDQPPEEQERLKEHLWNKVDDGDRLAESALRTILEPTLPDDVRTLTAELQRAKSEGDELGFRAAREELMRLRDLYPDKFGR